jgi:hypothetical protein
MTAAPAARMVEDMTGVTTIVVTTSASTLVVIRLAPASRARLKIGTGVAGAAAGVISVTSAISVEITGATRVVVAGGAAVAASASATTVTSVTTVVSVMTVTSVMIVAGVTSVMTPRPCLRPRHVETGREGGARGLRGSLQGKLSVTSLVAPGASGMMLGRSLL